MKKLLAVSIDDNEANLMVLEAYVDMLDFDIEVKSFSDPEEGLEFILDNEKDIDILYIDFNMPKLTGVDVIKSFRMINEDTPIIMITANGDNDEVKEDAFTVGANDFLDKPINQLDFKLRSKNFLDLRKGRLELKDDKENLEKIVEDRTVELREREIETLEILGKTAEWKDPETAQHVARVAHYSKLLAKESEEYKKGELSKDYPEVIYYAAPFHDIGKVGIPDRVLLKAGRLNDEEYDTMKEHPKIGNEILCNSKSKYLQLGAEISLTHHERFDGTGYPKGLAGKNIPISGRIVAIADVFDALTSVRPYKNAWTFHDAMDLLEEEKGKHFDPELVEIFMNNLDKVEEIYKRFQED